MKGEWKSIRIIRTFLQGNPLADSSTVVCVRIEVQGSAEVGREDRGVRSMVWTWWNGFEDVRGRGDARARCRIGIWKRARFGGGNMGATRTEVRR
jgi:hypothetical protein